MKVEREDVVRGVGRTLSSNTEHLFIGMTVGKKFNEFFTRTEKEGIE